MLVAAAVCPHPPLLVPELAAGAAAELDDLRRPATSPSRALATARPDEVVVVGADPGGGTYPGDGRGVDARVRRGRSASAVRTGSFRSRSPIGAWLVGPGRAAVAGQLRGHRAGCHGGGPASRSAASWPAAQRRTALLVMGDGSARRTTESPGRYDERAEPFDAAVADALSAGDAAPWPPSTQRSPTRPHGRGPSRMAGARRRRRVMPRHRRAPAPRRRPVRRRLPRRRLDGMIT